MHVNNSLPNSSLPCVSVVISVVRQIHPEASKPARQGANVAWTSGTMGVDINADPASLSPKVSPKSCTCLSHGSHRGSQQLVNVNLICDASDDSGFEHLICMRALSKKGGSADHGQRKSISTGPDPTWKHESSNHTVCRYLPEETWRMVVILSLPNGAFAPP